MTKAKKYDYRVVQDNTCWTAEITRRITSKKTIVSKNQNGFVTESEALEWAQKEIKTFLQNLNERNKNDRNKRDSKQRK